MANRTIFSNHLKTFAPPLGANTFNDAGGKAYNLSDEQLLARMTMTGTINDTFYADAELQLKRVLEAAANCSVKYVAQTAVYARENGYMKDLPALLVAHLANRLPEDNGRAFRFAFSRVIDNGKMLRNFVQMIRSGVTGRKSFGSFPKSTIRWWLDTRTDEQLFRDSVGNDPSIADIIKLVHPFPRTKQREALYGYLIGKPVKNDLPEAVQHWEAWKKHPDKANIPNVDFRLLASVCSDPEVWKEIARNAKWQMTRMNLNTFARHGVFTDNEIVKLVAERLADANEVRRAKAFPYQLLAAYYQTRGTVPVPIAEALEAAMEIALENTPELPGNTAVCLDVSGSMGSSITGNRPGATSLVRCIDVAALYAAALVKKNPGRVAVLPFDTAVYQMSFNGEPPPVMAIAKKLAQFGGGGTDCGKAMAAINNGTFRPQNVIYISDNESWRDGGGWATFNNDPTGLSREWNKYKSKVPGAKLVCVDLVANNTTQAPERKDTLNIGGFSDTVFDLVSDFCHNRMGADHWVGQIKKIEFNV